ncbi:hypothetical protein BC628DRAFT_1383449 [Trametes gibbosa]|nr:hypothetical protein BC628DRAFT_1383449 [Trametes gibbosa]
MQCTAPSASRGPRLRYAWGERTGTRASAINITTRWFSVCSDARIAVVCESSGAELSICNAA